MENSKKKNGEYKESVKIIGHSLKSSLKKHKVLWGFGIVIVVLIIAVSVFSAVVSSQNFSARMIDMLMPSYLPVTEDTRVKIEFHREINEEYLNSDSKIEDDNYIEMFNYYYIDENGEKQYRRLKQLLILLHGCLWFLWLLFLLLFGILKIKSEMSRTSRSESVRRKIKINSV